MNEASETDRHLTKNQSLVLHALHAKNTPLSAYTILDALRDDGLRAPLQVYRALDKLVEYGMVHKVESLNAFIACNDPQCSSHATVAFAICDTCNSVTEVANENLSDYLLTIANDGGFTLKQSIVELRGSCQKCGQEFQVSKDSA